MILFEYVALGSFRALMYIPLSWLSVKAVLVITFQDQFASFLCWFYLALFE